MVSTMDGVTRRYTISVSVSVTNNGSTMDGVTRRYTISVSVSVTNNGSTMDGATRRYTISVSVSATSSGKYYGWRNTQGKVLVDLRRHSQGADSPHTSRYSTSSC